MLVENIFYSLFKSKDYFRVVYPHLESRYFSEDIHKILFQKIKEYQEQFNKIPSPSDIKLTIETDNSISENDSKECYDFLKSLSNIEKIEDEQLLVKETEKFCQNRALELAILDSVEILQDKKQNKGTIEDKIKTALAVEFDVKIGMDFFKDALSRYETYIQEEEIVPTDVELLNTLLNGGFRKKAIHCFLGRVNIGKSAVLCSLASSFLKQGKNVIYISGEMSESMIGKRIDANVLDIDVNSLNANLDKKEYISGIKSVFAKTQGRLVIKEYATGSANANHIKNLLKELKIKRNFVPEVIILDYLNIFSSSRLNSNAALNSYQYIKSIAEEMRGIAVEFNVAFITASQVNRGNANTGVEIDMTATSESWGLPQTCDWMAAIVQNDELFEQKKYIFKNIKSRFDSNVNQHVTIGINYNRMRLLNLDTDQQEIPLHIKDKLKREEQKNNETNDFDFS